MTGKNTTNWEKEIYQFIHSLEGTSGESCPTYWHLREKDIKKLIKFFRQKFQQLIEEARNKGLDEGLATANRGKLYNLVVEKTRQKERERIIKHLKNYLIEKEPLCEQNVLLTLIIKEIE